MRLLIITATLISFSYILNAQAQNKTEDNFCHQIDSYIRYIPSRSVDAMSGEVEIIESRSEYSCELNPVRNTKALGEDNKISNGVKAFDELPIKFSFETQYIGIEDTTEVELPSHLTGLTTDIETTLPFFNFKETFLRLGISPSFYGDDWDFETSSFRIPTRYLLIQQPNARWTFIAGVGIYPDFENVVWPILGFIYKPNDKLTFNIIPKRPNISYLLNNRVTLFAEGGGSFNSEFEVTKDNSKNVVLRYKETHLAGGIKFKLSKFIQSSISAGSIFNRSLKYRDGLGKVNIKDGLILEFRVEIEL